jgi:hypothetical protein
MSSKYMTGKDIIKHYKIFSFELFGYVKNGLRPYTKTERVFNCPKKYNIKIQLNGINHWIAKLEHTDCPKNLDDWEKERVSGYTTHEIMLYELKQDQIKYIKKMERLKKKTGDRSWSWYYYDPPYSAKEEEELINEIVKSYFLKDDVEKIIPFNKKLNIYRRHEEACQKAAKKEWDKDPSLTIPAMCERPEIIRACGGENYVEKTIRRWIKDLNPDNKPGRPKGT